MTPLPNRITVLALRRVSTWAILVPFMLLVIAYAWASPPLEASDELWHMGMINVIADTGELPVQVIDTETAWAQEGSQPPLYYAIGAALVRGIDRSDFDAVRQPNPHAITGVPGAVGNKNLVLHDSPHPALQGTALAVYVLRAFSILCAVVTVIAVMACARLIAPDKPLITLMAGAITAFNPMFLFISASVNNDNLVIALSSLVIWHMLILLRDGFSTRRSIVLAVLIALAALTKLSGLVLIPVIAAAALWGAFQRRDRAALRGLIHLAVLMIAAWALLAGWWYLRNLSLYGDLFGTRMMAAVAGERETAFTLRTLIDEFQGFRFTFWGVFGGVNIMTVRAFYDVMDAFTLLSVLGVLIYLVRTRDVLARVCVLLLGLLMGIGTLSIIGWTSQTYASQGRLLFPYMAAIGPLFALGWHQVVSRLGRRVYPLLMAGSMAAFGAFALIVPFLTIAPAYAPPSPITALPADANPVYARFGDLALIGYQSSEARYQPGDSVPVTVYWQVIAPTNGIASSPERDLSLYLHAIVSRDEIAVSGDSGATIGRVDSYPGAGTLRTSTWLPGAIYADTYAILLDEIPPGAVEPSRLRIQVGWWDFRTGENITAADANGAPLTSVMLDAGSFAESHVTQSIADTQPADVSFGGVIRLRGYQQAGDALSLEWETFGALSDDYTVFAQVIDSAGALVGQGDAAPELPTHFWRSGETFVTRHTLTYPQPLISGDTYRVIVGWYRPSDFLRLATDSADNAYVLTTFTADAP